MSQNTQSSEHEIGVGRVLAFSDGVFAIAITLLVLDLKVPELLGGQNLTPALLKHWSEYVSYVLSFIIIGIIWTNHHGMFRHIKRSNHVFLLINIVFLMWVSFLPFPTAVLARYLGTGNEESAVAIYAGTFVVGALLFNILWRYAIHGRRLLGTELDEHAIANITRSYNVGPITYLISFGLAFVWPTGSLVLLFLLGLFYALSPIRGETSSETLRSPVEAVDR